MTAPPAGGRLLTVVGPPSRARDDARRRAAGRDPVIVSLDAAADGFAVAAALAAALGFDPGDHDPLGHCMKVLEEGDHLVVLDGCDGVVAGVRFLVAELLSTCPLVRIVATCDRPLGITGEYTVEVGATDRPHDLPAHG